MPACKRRGLREVTQRLALDARIVDKTLRHEELLQHVPRVVRKLAQR